MNHHKFFILSLIILSFLCGCDEDNITTPENNNNKIQATGTFIRETVDKEKWGDFLLILELDQATFDKTVSFPFSLSFKNIGTITITLDGILPYRQSANPPHINMWRNDTLFYQINTISNNLLNEDKITIEPEEQVILMQGDLAQTSGEIFYRLITGASEEVGNLASAIKSGVYHIQGHFLPTPQIYGSDTDTLTFYVQ